MLEQITKFQETFLQEHTSFSQLGKKGLYIALDGDELKLKQLNFIQQIARKVFGMYAETHSKTIKAKFNIADKINLKNYISSAQFTCEGPVGDIEPLKNSSSSFDVKELRKDFVPLFFSTENDRLDSVTKKLYEVIEPKEKEVVSVTRIAPNSLLVMSMST